MTTTTATHYDTDLLSLIGKKVIGVRHMTPKEIESFDWYDGPEDTTLIEFHDGTVAIVSADPEGNGAGHIFVGSYK